MKKYHIGFGWLFIFMFFVCHQAAAQQVYKLSYATDFSIAGVGIATNVPAFILHKKKPVLTEQQINALNRMDIWKVDRFATNYWNPKVAKASDAMMFTSMAIPALLLINKQVRSEAGKITLMYAETWLLNAGLTNLTKELAKRRRPFVYNTDAPLSKKQHRDATSSFFSGHTSFSAASTFFMAKVYADMNPNSKWKPYIWTGAAILPLTTGILRVAAGKHFPTDVLVGYIIGAATGILVPHLHKVNKRQVFP